MQSASIPFVFLEVSIGLLAVGVASLAWLHRDELTGPPLFIMAGTAVVYALLSSVGSVVTDPLVWHLAHSLLFPLTTVIAVSSLFLTLHVTNHHDSLPSVVSLALFGLVVVSFLAAVTDPVHNLFIAERTRTAVGAFSSVYGPLFWVNTIVSLGIVLCSIGLLSIGVTVATGMYRQQLAAVLLGLLLGVGFFLWEALVPISPRFNLATVGIVGWCGATLWGVIRVDLLRTAPIARTSLIESMDDAVFAIDTDDRIVDLNPAASDQFALDPEAVGAPVQELLADYPSLVEPIETRQPASEVAVSIDGQERYVDVNVSPVTVGRTGIAAGGDTQQIGHTIVIRDITEHKRREQELERQNERLDRFASVVSHDLRNPLTVANGRLALAREDCDSEHLDAIETALDRIDRITEDVLWLAREGRDIGSLDSVALQAAIESAWSLVADDAAGADLDYGDDALSTATIEADYDRLQQLLENLLVNAIEHGGEDVTVTAGTVAHGFYIADDGPGIPEGQREDVFTAGYSTDEDGTGFGLSIVKEVAEAHGWDVRVTDAATGGARFEITGIAFTE